MLCDNCYEREERGQERIENCKECDNLTNIQTNIQKEERYK